jgi:DNA-binding NarL/FixJ family response regulator
MARSRNLRKTRVLIVDDSAKLREGLTSLCELQSKLEVVGTAGDGVEALEAIRNLKPDVVSLDIRMPKMSGIEVLRAIRRDRLTCTPIILSGMVDKIFREKCLKLGARYVFDKGTELEKYLRALGRSRKTKRKSRGVRPSPGAAASVLPTGLKSTDAASHASVEVRPLLRPGTGALRKFKRSK